MIQYIQYTASMHETHCMNCDILKFIAMLQPVLMEVMVH